MVESLKGRFGKLRETMATSFRCSHSFRMGVGHLNTKRGLCIDISQPALTAPESPQELVKNKSEGPAPTHSDSGGASLRNRHLTSSHGWPALDLPNWIGLQGPEAEQLSSQGWRPTWAGNVEGSTPRVCQSRKYGSLGWRGNGPAKKLCQ